MTEIRSKFLLVVQSHCRSPKAVLESVRGEEYMTYLAGIDVPQISCNIQVFPVDSVDVPMVAILLRTVVVRLRMPHTFLYLSIMAC